MEQNLKPAAITNLKVKFFKSSTIPRYLTKFIQDPTSSKPKALNPFRAGRILDPAKSVMDSGNFEVCSKLKGVKFTDRVWEVMPFVKEDWAEEHSYNIEVDGEMKWLNLNWGQNKAYQEALGDVDWKTFESAVVKFKNKANGKGFDVELIETKEKEDDGFNESAPIKQEKATEEDLPF